MPKRLHFFLVVIVSGAILFSLTILIFFPADLIEGVLQNSVAENTGLTVRTAYFERVFPFGVEARGVRVAGAGAPPGAPPGASGPIPAVVFMDRLTVRLKPLSVLTGSIRSRISGSIMDGAFNGIITLKRGGGRADVEFDGIAIERIPALKSAGVGIKGSVRGRIGVSVGPSGCAEGTIKAKGLDLEGGGLRVLGFPLPFGEINDAGIELELTEDAHGCVARLKGLWIEGSGMTARLSGEIRLVSPLGGSPIDLVLEVIPKGEKATEVEDLFFLAPYKRSANYYSINVKGTVGMPRI
jgi:type II secretion system protein N